MLLYVVFILFNMLWTIRGYSMNCNVKHQVCGNDGRTYKTICHLNFARLEDFDLDILHEGSCYFFWILQPNTRLLPWRGILKEYYDNGLLKISNFHSLASFFKPFTIM